MNKKFSSSLKMNVSLRSVYTSDFKMLFIERFCDLGPYL